MQNAAKAFDLILGIKSPNMGPQSLPSPLSASQILSLILLLRFCTGDLQSTLRKYVRWR